MFHPSEYKILFVTASAGSILELYRQILSELGIDAGSSSRAVMIRKIKHEILEFARGKKMKVVLIIDEASLFQLGVFAELHTLTQFESDSKPFLPLVLTGQANLIDSLQYRNSMPLASRVVGKCHLQGVDRQGMEDYLCTICPSPAFTIIFLNLQPLLRFIRVQAVYSEKQITWQGVLLLLHPKLKQPWSRPIMFV